jgi:dinuclear metal center YbgI/SA1388 family protein
MLTINDVCELLEELAPVELAEEWDNVGLLVGEHSRTVSRVMTCLTLTPASVAEAVEQQADLVVTHHPLPFRPVGRITQDTVVGRMLLDLIAARISVFSSHTAYDSARSGINQQLAAGIGLQNVDPLMPSPQPSQGHEVGAGRCGLVGQFQTLAELAVRLKAFLHVPHVRTVGDGSRSVQRVAVACGSGGSLLAAARQRECDCFITGETNFHTCLEAEASGMAMILCGHYASERFALEWLANHLSQQLPGVECWASRLERDPLQWV